MRRKGIVLGLIALLLVTVLSLGCLGNKTETTGTTSSPTPLPTTAVPAALDLHKQGFAAYSTGNYTAALDLYDRAIAADPGYNRAWIDKGNVLLELNRSAEAIAVYDVVLERNTLVPYVWNNRGKALMAVGNYSAARDSFDRALQIAPEFTEAQENRDRAQKMLQ